MKFRIENGDKWLVEVITSEVIKAPECPYFTVQCRATEEQYCRDGLDTVCAMLTLGRTVMWRVRPSYERSTDFETNKTWWSGYARFTFKTIGTIERDLTTVPPTHGIIGPE